MTDYDWAQHPEAEQLVTDLLNDALDRSPRLTALSDNLARHTSTRLIDWLDHLAAPVSADRLTAAGYARGWRTTEQVWRHPAAQLPAIVPAPQRIAALRVDDAAAFAQAHGSTAGVTGSPLSGLRRAIVSGHEPVRVTGVERRLWSCGVQPHEQDPGPGYQAWQLWAERPRHLSILKPQLDIAGRMVDLVGPGLAASYVLELERQYWQSRNTAAVLQHGRQNRFGLGWGNNDHHTFRSGRAGFAGLLAIFERLGFEFRERFYAGDQAGWGAQVLEHPETAGVIFADVDLEPGEIDHDFAAQPLPPANRLGTVGLWCALHGDSILGAGMHHLEGQFDFDALRADLPVGHMAPFSNFPHLRQAFTEAERWPVPADRIAPLLAAGQIDKATATRFATEGAPGSHLENLARRNGFKGFNQHNVSTTMLATNPRDY